MYVENRMYGKTLYSISLGVSPFYRELQEIFMDDHPQITIVVQNLVFKLYIYICYKKKRENDCLRRQ